MLLLSSSSGSSSIDTGVENKAEIEHVNLQMLLSILSRWYQYSNAATLYLCQNWDSTWWP